MPYCVPVIAERQHVAETAQRSHVRRKNAEGPARRLSEVVAERLRGRGLDPGTTEWDAWRRDDGRWTVKTTYHSGERERAGIFVFDMAGRYSVADDDEAKWLTGEKQSSSHGPQPRGTGAGERRLSAVPDGDDLLSLSAEERAEGDDLDAVMRAVQEEEVARASEDADTATGDADTAEATAKDADAEDADTAGDEDAATATADDEDADTPDAEDTADAQVEPERLTASGDAGDESAAAETEPTPRKRRQRRASVPSWDEIMFGKDGSND
jgi:hypothetical protein